MAILFLLLAGIFLNCNTKHPGSKLGVTDVLFLQIAQNSVSLNGKVTNGNGYIIGGRVIVTALAVNGTCDKTATGSAIIAETTSDTSGNYSTTFNRTGQPVCVITIPNKTGSTQLYDGKIKKTIPWAGSDLFVQAVTAEPAVKTPDPNSFNFKSSQFSRLNITPLTRIASQRIGTLSANNSRASNLASFLSSANRLATFRFNLRAPGQSSSIKPSFSPLFPGISRAVTPAAELPEITDLDVNLDDPNNPLVKQMALLLSGFTQLASKGAGSNATVSASNYENAIGAFEDDFADGTFDGRGATNNVIVIDQAGKAAALGSDPLKVTLKSAVKDFIIQSGGGKNSPDLAVLNEFTFKEAGTSDEDDDEPNDLTVFVTDASYDGDLGGIAGADAKCNDDTNSSNPDGVFKAVLYTNGNGNFQYAFSTGVPDFASSAFQPDRFYFTEDENGDFFNVTVLTENATIPRVYYLDETGAILMNELYDVMGFGSDQVWTGDATNHCVNWSSNLNTDNGQYGTEDDSDTPWYNSGTDTCDQPKKLFCAEQP